MKKETIGKMLIIAAAAVAILGIVMLLPDRPGLASGAGESDPIPDPENFRDPVIGKIPEAAEIVQASAAPEPPDPGVVADPVAPVSS